MSNETTPKYGTGEFPPPRAFADSGRGAPAAGGEDAFQGATRYMPGCAEAPLGADAASTVQRYRSYATHDDPTMAPLRVIALLCALMLATFAIGGAFWFFGDEEEAASPQGGKGGAPIGQLARDDRSDRTSTPREEWAQGEVPRLFQTDGEWAAAPYAEGTIATHGCGPTCLSMVYVALTGKGDLDPRDMAEFSELNGYIDGGVTSWLLMGEGARLLGLQSEEVPGSVDAVAAQLAAGKPVICSVHAGDFTDEGHFIVICGMHADGTVEIRDPNSEDRTSKAWDLGRVVSQCDNIWAFSA